MNYFKFKDALIKKNAVEDGYKYTVTIDGKDIAAGSVQGLVKVLNEKYKLSKTDILDNIFVADFKEFDMDPKSYSAKINAACKLSDATKNLQAYKYWMEIIVPESALILAGIPEQYWGMIQYQYTERNVLRFDYPYDWTELLQEAGYTEIPSLCLIAEDRRSIPTYDALYEAKCWTGIVSLEIFVDDDKPSSADLMISLGASIQYGVERLENFDINTNLFMNVVKLDGETFPSWDGSRPSELLKDYYAYLISSRSFEKLSSEEILDIFQTSENSDVYVYENVPEGNLVDIMNSYDNYVQTESISNVRFHSATLISKKNTVK